ncbi:MAG: polysaccharide deacetylase family protein [Bryobacteraceae bacterium]|jgi:peptidoglycan/xylan/chitin deacetylase (PgdA/CDA1 family)
MLRALKLTTLRMAQGLGLNSLLLQTRWRRRRLLILCYHGVSLEDEHEWGPALYLPPALFRERMEALRRMDCAVLPFGDALSRLYAGSLPARAVALTFDDGGYDFYRVAYPILREYDYPVTLYLTTYYAQYNRPVFDVMLPYLLWKGRSKILVWPELLRDPVRLQETGRVEVARRLKEHVRNAAHSAGDKDRLLASLAGKLGIDYERLCAKRVLQLMTLEEARDLAARGLSIQLHTHRHRLSRQRELFAREIEDNRRSIAQVAAAPAVHFCYPGGFHLPESVGFLEELGVQSAVTCEPGLAGDSTNRYLLPRFLDSTNVTPVEFAAWVSGFATFLSRRSQPVNPDPLSDGAASG